MKRPCREIPMSRILLATVAFLFASAVAAQAYRWVDKDGKVHYSQTPPPRSEAAKVEKRTTGGSVVESTPLPYATQQAAKNHPVTIYTAEVCTDACSQARALLSQRGVPFREVAVTDENTRAELKKVSGGDEVPVLTVGRQVTKGYLAETWHTALDSAGYPRSGPPLAAKAQKPEAQPAANAEAPEPAAAAQAPQQSSGRYAPPPPSAKEAQEAASQEAARTGRYAPPAGDASAPATPATGPYAPK
jgi:glutaredoxin